MRYLIKFSYDGSNYAGYQIQPGLDTIQKRLEDAVKIVVILINIISFKWIVFASI